MARIGIDARLTYYRTGGISTYIRHLVEALQKLDGVNDYTILHRRGANERIGSGFRRADLWTPSHHRLEQLALSLELLPHRLDLLHSPDFIPPLRGAKRHVITVHDLTFLHYPQYLTDDSRRYYNGHIASAVQKADHILSDSEATRHDMMTLLNVPGDKITVHMLGVGEQFTQLPQTSIVPVLQRYSLPETGYILCVGTLEPRKNIAGLLEAYRLLRDKLVDSPPLVLVGRPGWLFDEIQAAMQAANLGGDLIWLQNVTDDALPAVYNGALTLITPSFYEGFGLPALEAMACGIVPIVSDRSSLPEITGDVGLRIEPEDPVSIADALHRVLTDTTWRESESQRARVRAGQFTWNQCARSTLDVYTSLL